MRNVACAIVVFSAACGGSSTDDAGPPDLASPAQTTDLLAGTDLGGGEPDMTSTDLATPADGGGGCNTLLNAAAAVQQTMINQPMPTPTTGGTIASGTYYLTSSAIYQGAPPGVTPMQLQATQSISGMTVQTVQRLGMAGNDLFDTRTYSTSGTTLSIVVTCGGSGSATAGFDATSTQYKTYNNSTKVVNTWTLQ